MTHILTVMLGLFTMPQVLGYPFPATLVSGADGKTIAWVLDERGVRNVYVAQSPQFTVRNITHQLTDDGQEITNLAVAKDGKHVVFVRGGDHDANWSEALQPDPASSPMQQQMQVYAASLDGSPPKVIGDGDAPAISPDGRRVAFIQNGAVWSAPIDGSAPAKRLFFDRGADSELAWSPDGSALAFVSDRTDHAFIGIFRNDATPLQYLAPSTGQDFEPRWSPDGHQVAFVRIPGEGGAPQSRLQLHPQPWAIWVADAASGQGREVWHSATTLRDSLPQIRGPQLEWAAGDRLVFISERDNWPHLYAVPSSGGAAQLLTPGRFMVEETALSTDLRDIFYTANTGSLKTDDDRRHIFRVSVTGGAPELITPRGDVNSETSPAVTADGSLAFMQWGPQTPPLIAVGPGGGNAWRVLDRDRVPSDFPASELVRPREVKFRSSDGWTIEGQIFDAAGGAARKPGVIFVHGGPPRQMLLTWHYMDYYSNAYAVNQYLASRGFVVLSVNYRLGIGYGHDFHHPAHAGPAGAAEYRDVLAGARFLQRYAGVDPQRIGIWGGSYGGYLTAMGLARDSKIFKAGVDYHGVHDWSMFPQWFGQETARYQTANQRAFLRTAWLSSPDSSIATWRSPVLLIQGDDDRNVPFHQMVDLVRRLDAAHVPYQQIVIPNEIHGFLRYASWLQADQATADFLTRMLHP